MKITISSFGHKWPEDYPKPPEKKVIQAVYDIRASIRDPFPSVRKSGLNKDVQKIIFSGDGADICLYLGNQMHDLVDQVLHHNYVLMSEPRYEEIRIFIGCMGGFQRSVAFVERIYKTLEERYHNQKKRGDTIKVEKRHISLPYVKKLIKG